MKLKHLLFTIPGTVLRTLQIFLQIYFILSFKVFFIIIVIAINMRKYWVGQKVHSDFSVRSDTQTRMHFLANPIVLVSPLHRCSEFHVAIGGT